MKVDISSHFKSGNLQTPYFVDFPFLNEETKRLIADFIADVIEGKPLEGINKPSWVNRNYDELETAENTKPITVGITISDRITVKQPHYKYH